MKKNISSSHMPMLALAAGLSGAFARIILYRLGTDGQGLLIRNHPLHILCWILSAATVVCLWTAVKKSPEPAAASNSYDPVFPLSLACAWGIGTCVLEFPLPQDRLALIRMILGVLAAFALIWSGYRQWRRKPCGVYSFALVCVFFAAHLVCCYRVWSGNPQLADYTWQLFAVVCLILASYQKCALQAGLGKEKAHQLLCLLAGFFCMMAAPGSGCSAMYLTCGLYFLCTAALPRKQEDAL